MSDSGAPASTRAADTASVRGVAFGCAKVAVSMTMPAISAAARAPSAVSSGKPKPGGQERDHLAGRRGRRVDPVGLARPLVRGVVVDDDSRQALEQVGMAPADVADAVQRAAVGDHEQVVGGLRVRVGPEALHAPQEVVQGRDRVGADGVGTAAQGLHEMDDPERGSERVGVGVLVADGQHAPRAAQPIDDGVRNGVEVRREVDGHRRSPVPRLRP